ncbi:MAG: glycosyltransferase family 2 protein [Pirellulales bacterium]
MASEPLVSAIIPAYNCGRFVTEAVESACAQTYSRLEVIVVDDGSTDDTYERLTPFLHRIRYLRQENRGLSAARNAGIAASQGEWIALLDADDVWHPEKTAVQIAAAREYDVWLVGARPCNVLPRELPPRPPARYLDVADFLQSAPLGPSGAIVRRQCFEEVGVFDETLRSIEDRDMWLRIATRFACLQVDSPCWWYRVHHDQMSRRATRMYENYRRVLDKFFAENPSYSRLRSLAYSYLYVDTAWAYFSEGDRWNAVRFLVLSGCRHPRPFRGAGKTFRWWRAKELVRYTLGDRILRHILRGRWDVERVEASECRPS